MGFLDRWLQRFLQGAAAPTSEPGTPHAAPQPAPAPLDDPIDALLQKTRARLTLDEAGRRYAESDSLRAALATVDAAGRSRAGDALLADALLVTPSLPLRRLLAERLLYRGERERAFPLLQQLSQTQEEAAFAWLGLGELAEHRGEVEEALRCYEQILAFDIRHEQAKSRARRLRIVRESAAPARVAGRSNLTRFLGARAAGSRYAVLDEIGRGGAATVFRARDRVVDRDVALKIFHPRGRTAERRLRIVREARIAGYFDHPHIVPILDIDAERDLLVMSLCDGGSLRQRLTERRLGFREALDLGGVLLRTLADVHDAGHIHLDLKPSNLLIHEERLMLCDFGTAGLVEAGIAAGTRAYMAPEQKRGAGVGPAADLYTCGIVLYELLEGGLPPRRSDGETEISLQSLPQGPRRRALEGLIASLCAREPTQRPTQLRAFTERWLQAGALPQSDSDGETLLQHLVTLAERDGSSAVEALTAHPDIRWLQRDTGPRTG